MVYFNFIIVKLKNTLCMICIQPLLIAGLPLSVVQTGHVILKWLRCVTCDSPVGDGRHEVVEMCDM